MDTFIKREQIFQKVEDAIKNPKKLLRAILIIAFVFYFIQISRAAFAAGAIDNLVADLKTSVKDKNFAESSKILKEIKDKTETIGSSVKNLFPITKLPIVSGETKAVVLAAKSASETLGSAVLVAEWINSSPILSKGEFSSFENLTEEDRSSLLKYLNDSPELLKKISQNTSKSSDLLLEAEKSTKIPIFNSKIKSIIEQIKQYQQILEKIEPWLAVAPSVLGYEKERTYLILLQNNTELRPTGGFIGTYGVLKIKNAKVAEFTTDNVYNLDEPSKSYNTKIPPQPLQKYIKQSQWFFRDSNWDPDFPSSAQNAIQFYKDEKGHVKHFDGVISFTPDLIEDMLLVIGPIYSEGKEFTAENLVDTLAYHVEKGFKEQGINIYNRKKIIDDIAQQMKQKIFSMSSEKIKSMLPIVFKNFDEKQLMMWFEDKNAQKIVEKFNLGNAILKSEKDYFYIVDANLGSLKSDPAIKKSIEYSIEKTKDNEYVSKVSITYEHTAGFDWKTTRYRTYTRVYVPQGSSLVSASGNEEDIKVSSEHGKTVFGTFISIEPKSKETLSFSYKLPKDMIEKIKDSGYSILIQKQGGTPAHQISLKIDLPFEIGLISSEPEIRKKSKNSAIGEFKLEKDKFFSINKK